MARSLYSRKLQFQEVLSGLRQEETVFVVAAPLSPPLAGLGVTNFTSRSQRFASGQPYILQSVVGGLKVHNPVF